MINLTNPLLIVPVLGAALLVGCGQESVVHSANVVRFETNATYVAVQDGPVGVWQVKISENTSNLLSQKSLVLKDPAKRYGVVFVCPGADDSASAGFTTVKSHQATAFFATADELSQISFLCRQVLEAKAVGKIFGSIKPDSPSVPGGEESPNYVDIAIGEAVSVRALEAYATEVIEGQHDVLAMTGPLNDSEEIQPTAFYSGSGNSFTGKATPTASNIQFTAGSPSATLVDPLAQRTTVTVAGGNDLAADEKWAARVGFVGQNRGYLLLKESREPSFEFTRVPAYRIGAGRVISRNKFISDKQAHEFTIRVLNGAGIEQRAFYHFFQDQGSIAAALPARPLSNPEVEVLSNATRATVRAKWTSYADTNVGPGSVYRLEVNGFAVPKTVKDQPAPPAKPLVWTSYVTRSWADSDPMIFTLPNLSAAQGWDNNWDFKANSPITWTHHSYASRSKAGLVIEYLENRKVTDKLDFAVVHQAGSAGSP